MGKAVEPDPRRLRSRPGPSEGFRRPGRPGLAEESSWHEVPCARDASRFWLELIGAQQPRQRSRQLAWLDHAEVHAVEAVDEGNRRDDATDRQRALQVSHDGINRFFKPPRPLSPKAQDHTVRRPGWVIRRRDPRAAVRRRDRRAESRAVPGLLSSGVGLSASLGPHVTGHPGARGRFSGRGGG